MNWLKKDPLAKIPIKFKLPLSFVALYLIVFGAGGYFIVNSIYESLNKEIIARLRSESLAQAAIFDKKLETLARRAEDFASDGFIRTHTEILSRLDSTTVQWKKSQQLLKNHLKRNKLPLIDEFFDLQVFDLNLKKLTGIKPSSINLEQFFKFSSPGSQTHFSDIIPPTNTISFPSVAIITPLLDIKRKQKIGYLICSVNLEQLIKSLVKEYDSPEVSGQLEKSLMLIDNHGGRLEVPYSFFKNTSRNGAHQANVEPVVLKYLGANQGDFPALHHARHTCKNGQDMFGQSYPLHSTGWSVLIELNAQNALKPIEVLEANLLGVALIVAFSTLLLLFFPVQFVIRPLGDLQKVAFRIKDGDFSARVNIDSEDEIGNLARSFNLMADAIEEYTSRLKKTAEDLKKQEQELRVQHDRLNTVVHSMTDGLILLNNKNEIVLHNQAAMPFVQLLQNSSPHFLIRKCNHEQNSYNTCLHCLLDTSLKTSCTLTIGESIYEVITTQLPAINGSAGKVLVARDITEREKINERQAHQERLAVLGKTAAIVAHEMNSPLAAISMYNQMMESELDEGSPFHEHVGVIKRNTQTCQRIINQLLNYARTPQPNIQKVNLHKTIENVAHFLQPVCKNKKIELQIDLQAKQPVILGDATQLQQILVNLIMNAIQAVPEKTGKIKLISMESSNGNEINILIEDNGNGIDEKHQSEIFEPFFTTKKTGGTGLGLSTAKRIANAHGGDVLLYSSRPGKTIFAIHLPFAQQGKTQLI